MSQSRNGSWSHQPPSQQFKTEAWKATFLFGLAFFAITYYSQFSAFRQTKTLRGCESVHLLLSRLSATVISPCRIQTAQTARPRLWREKNANVLFFFLLFLSFCKSHKHPLNAGRETTPPGVFWSVGYLPWAPTSMLFDKTPHQKKTKGGTLMFWQLTVLEKRK